MTHHLIPRRLSLLKMILKIQEKHILPHHLSLLKNNSKNSRSMSHHIYPLKNNYKNLRKSPHPTSHSSLKNNLINSRKIYYNSLQVINDEFSQHASNPNHLMSHYLSPLKNNSKKSRKYIFFQISHSTVEKLKCSPCKFIFLPLIISINFCPLYPYLYQLSSILSRV
jgi:hypothetical protein